jgi:hypothetical protein
MADVTIELLKTQLRQLRESGHDNRWGPDQVNRWFAPCAAGGMNCCVAA